ncbi:MAG: helix-turn-helix domain-containing protein [Candidatus Micrarchaeota archaeon]
MWVAEFKVWHETSETMKLTARYDVVVTSIYLNEFRRGGHTYITKALAVNGPQWKEYLKELLKHEKRYHINKIEGNHVYFTIPYTSYSYHVLIMEQDVFFVKPFILKGGYEYWFVGSWRKENLLKLKNRIARHSEHAKMELLSLKEGEVDFFVPDILERLPEKRREVLRRAVELGYYEFPRRINLKQLAKKLHLSPATVREHVRFAENALMPLAFRQMHSGI